MKKVAFFTLGCKVNQYETQVMSEKFKKAGYKEVDFNNKSDVYVINTCTVTHLGDRKSRQMIRRARKNNKDAVVAVVGCYSQIAPEEVKGIDGVDIVLGTRDKNNIVDFVEKYINNNTKMHHIEDIMKNTQFEDMSITSYKEKTRAFLKVQEGCNQFCSYCIIPYARGPIRSKEPKGVLDEVKNLSKNGFKEIVLTGIHLTSYGKDLKDTNLLELIKSIHDVEGIKRIRLGSLEPLYLTDKFISEASRLTKLCPHYHISLQSGCDTTLERMNRKYTTNEYLKIVNNLREYINDVSITTDIMVGFPGETDEEFNTTVEFVKKVSFSNIHVFKYSKRKGTKAAEFKGQISPQVKEERSKILIKIGKELEKEFYNKFLKTKTEVLFEKKINGDRYEGYTPNYINVIARSKNDISNTIKKVRTTEVLDDHMLGEII